MIRFLKKCEKEIAELPEEVREDLADALAMLDQGIKLSMPLSRPMPMIGKRVHELRLKDRAGIYRIFYVLVAQNDIWIIHAFMKKSQATPQQIINLVKKRLQEI